LPTDHDASVGGFARGPSGPLYAVSPFFRDQPAEIRRAHDDSIVYSAPGVTLTPVAGVTGGYFFIVEAPGMFGLLTSPDAVTWSSVEFAPPGYDEPGAPSAIGPDDEVDVLFAGKPSTGGKHLRVLAHGQPGSWATEPVPELEGSAAFVGPVVTSDGSLAVLARHPYMKLFVHDPY